MSTASFPGIGHTGFEYDRELILYNIFVLESEQASIQGTCFNLEGFGLITCEHVLKPDLTLFHPSNINQRFKVEVLACNSVIDIALVAAPALELGPGLMLGSTSNLNFGSAIAIAGFPNYRFGDSGIINSGQVIG